MSTTDFLKVRDETFKKLIAEGWDYDDARFSTMSAGQIDGEGNQQTPTHPLLQELAIAKSQITIDDREQPTRPPRMANQFTDDNPEITALPDGDEYSDQIERT